MLRHTLCVHYLTREIVTMLYVNRKRKKLYKLECTQISVNHYYLQFYLFKYTNAINNYNNK